MHFFLTVVLLVSVLGLAVAVDPCKHYKVVQDRWRNVANKVKVTKCDKKGAYLGSGGWYRVTGAAGNKLADTCVGAPINMCGTQATMWLKGGHPSEKDGVVSRRICAHYPKGTCCQKAAGKIVAKVKKCPGGYYVYKLPVLNTWCQKAYCTVKDTCDKCSHGCKTVNGSSKCTCPKHLALAQDGYNCVSTKDGCKWVNVPGGRMTWVSSGQAGVWAVSSRGYIYYRRGTYNKVNAIRPPVGSLWVHVSGSLSQISVGWNIVWGVDRYRRIFYRAGISQNNPKGTRWVQVSGGMNRVSVSPMTNAVWTVKGNNIYFRTGVTGTSPQGTGWKHISGSLKDVSVDGAGVWSVNYGNQIFYRKGTFENPNSPGSGWIRIRSGRLSNINSGNKVVWGVNTNGNVFTAKITGEPRNGRVSWAHVDYRKKQVSANGYDGSVWSVAKNGQIFYRRGV